MPNRMLRLIGGLLVIGALAVTAAAATADSPSAKPSGDPERCDDRYPPFSRWGDGWYGHDGDGPYWRGWRDGDGYFNGRSWDGYCNSSDRRGRVDRVMVAVRRVRGTRCQHLGRRDRLGRPTSCSRNRWLRARGTRRWRHDIGRSLPPGLYRLAHRAYDSEGNRGARHTRHLYIR